MSRKYQDITAEGPYQAEIYENCYARLQSNGRRFRLLVDSTKWIGNSGGFYQYRTYLDRSEGRKLLREIRKARLANARGDFYATPIEVMTESL